MPQTTRDRIQNNRWKNDQSRQTKAMRPPCKPETGSDTYIDALAQAARPGELPIQQRHELALGGQPMHPHIGSMLFNQAIEHGPRHMPENRMK
jgi:hypothetical protein